MTKKGLIKMLEPVGDDEEIQIFDSDAEEWLPVMSCTYGGNDKIVKLYCDED